jgi:uncharacterized membrane protein YccC
VDYERLHKGSEPIGITYGVVGVFYSLLFAFVLIGVWEDYEEAESNVYESAAIVNDLLAYGDHNLSDDTHLKEAAIAYLEASLYEWEVENYTAVNQKMSNALAKLKVAVHSLPDNPAEGYNMQAVSSMNSLESLSHKRIGMNSSHIPAQIWYALQLGAVICIAFLFLFKVEWRNLHVLLTIALTLIICLNLVIVFLLDHPFSGSTSISSEPFVNLLNNLSK